MGQLIAIAIFWIAGTVAAYFFMRDDRLGIVGNIRQMTFMLPVVGAMAGFVIFALALATTDGTVPDRSEDSYFSRSGR